MSATDDLRRLLDERGIEWRDGDATSTTEWQDESGAEWSAMEWAPTLSVLVSKRTPSQAVEIALGRGKCKWELAHSGTLYDKWQCSCCGYEFVEPRTDQGYTEMEPNFCPKCGREVER